MFTAIWVARSQGWRRVWFQKRKDIRACCACAWTLAKKNNGRRCDKGNAPRGDLF
jgi:endo-1,4-beta-D-glucanase Y